MPTTGIRNLIREHKIHQIYSAMQSGQEKIWTQTLNQSLASLYLGKRITREIALSVAKPKEELIEMLERGVGLATQRSRAPHLRALKR